MKHSKIESAVGSWQAPVGVRRRVTAWVSSWKSLVEYKAKLYRKCKTINTRYIIFLQRPYEKLFLSVSKTFANSNFSKPVWIFGPDLRIFLKFFEFQAMGQGLERFCEKNIPLFLVLRNILENLRKINENRNLPCQEEGKDEFDQKWSKLMYFPLTSYSP